MSYRNGTGRNSRHALWMLLVMIVGLSLLPACSPPPDERTPWFGRGRNLPRCPLTIVTGPITPKGIEGVLELGMKREKVEHTLGEALVKPMSPEEARKKGLIDPEDVANHFYGGVFAWVDYNADDEVMDISFELSALKAKMEIDQVLVVRLGDKVLRVSGQTDRQSLSGLLRSIQSAEIAIREEPASIAVEIQNSTISFHFSYEEKVSSVSFTVRYR